MLGSFSEYKLVAEMFCFCWQICYLYLDMISFHCFSNYLPVLQRLFQSEVLAFKVMQVEQNSKILTHTFFEITDGNLYCTSL